MRNSRVVGFITTHDMTVMRRCNLWMPPRWVRVWMMAATRGGDGWLWVAIGLAVLAFGGTDGLAAVLAAGLAGAIGVMVFLLLKKAANRPRPCAIAPHAWATLLPPDQFSFPSGHTMTAFGVITPLLAYFPELSVGLLFCAFSVAASRILLGMHFLSDVLAGAVLGVLVGFLAI